MGGPAGGFGGLEVLVGGWTRGCRHERRADVSVFDCAKNSRENSRQDLNGFGGKDQESRLKFVHMVSGGSPQKLESN